MVRVLTMPIIRLQHIIGDEVNSPDYGNTWEDRYFQLNYRVMNIFVSIWMLARNIQLHLPYVVDIPVVEELSATTHANGKDIRRDY